MTLTANEMSSSYCMSACTTWEFVVQEGLAVMRNAFVTPLLCFIIALQPGWNFKSDLSFCAIAVHTFTFCSGLRYSSWFIFVSILSEL